MKILFCMAAAIGLASCAGHAPPPEPIVRTVEVQVPVDDPACARALLAKLGSIPAYPDSQEALDRVADIFDAVRLLMAGRELRSARERALVEGVEQCAR